MKVEDYKAQKCDRKNEKKESKKEAIILEASRLTAEDLQTLIEFTKQLIEKSKN